MDGPRPIKPPKDPVTDRHKEWYGRFRLSFAQVSPWLSDYLVFARVRAGWRPLVEETIAMVKAEAGKQLLWPVHVLNQGANGKGGSSIRARRRRTTSM